MAFSYLLVVCLFSYSLDLENELSIYRIVLKNKISGFTIESTFLLARQEKF
jgi:hypothetical protein